MIRHISLHIREIAASPDSVAVFARRQLLVYYVVVFTIQAVKEPQLPFHDRTRHGKPGVHLVECPALFVLERRYKVRDRITETVVSNTGFDRKHSRRALPIFRRDPTRLNSDLAQSIGTGTHQQLAMGGLGDVESIK